MPNPRIISDNVATRCTLSASSTSGAFTADKLLLATKTDVWRAAAATTSATLTLTSATGESAAGVHLPFCNFSPAATIRVRLYSDTAGTSLMLDTGTVAACPAAAIALAGWTAAQAASAYSYGGGAHARVWFAATAFKRCVIDLADTGNLQGYLEAACLVVGTYWSPAKAASDAPLGIVDTTVDYRNGAGGLKSDAGTIHRAVPVDLGLMKTADRAKCIALLRNSRARPILLSVFPQSADLELERDYTVYGKRSQDSEIALQYAITYSTRIPVEEI